MLDLRTEVTIQMTNYENRLLKKLSFRQIGRNTVIESKNITVN